MLVIWHSVGSDSGHISVEIHHGGFFLWNWSQPYICQ